MANKSSLNTSDSKKNDEKRTNYTVEFGIFQQIEQYNERLGTNVNVMNLPPKNSKEYKNLLSAIEMNCIEINALDHDKVIGKNGKLVARVDSKTGKTLTGKVPSKTKRNKDEENEML